METHAGLIPREWEASTIGALATFTGGSQPPKATFRFKPATGYVRLVQIRDYKTDEFATYVPESLARRWCSADDIMVGRYGPPIFQILRGIDGAYNVALIKASPSLRVDREYLFHLLRQARLFQLIEALSRRSSGQTGVELPALRGFAVALPPVSEQRAIAAALSDVDALVSALDRLIAKKRLRSGRGNAMLVAGSIYEACKFYEIFARSPLAGKCAIVTSYVPNAAAIKGEESGEGATDRLEKYNIYRQMLADWFNEAPEVAVNKVEAFEKAVKQKFIEEPGQMELLIVVDKLLTGFDAPPATYLYIDKRMQDHGLFQAICRVNRLHGDDKEFGYIVDYKDLFQHLEGAVNDYTSGALDGFDKEDVAGLLEDRVAKAKERLEEALEAVRALCEPVERPRDDQAFYRYFSSREPADAAQLQANEPQRLALYKLTASLVRAYANIANELAEAGYVQAQSEAIKQEVTFYENLRHQIKLHSGDAIDLKQYEPAMRHLIDTYIRAEESQKVSEFDELSLIQLIVQRGAEAVEALPKPIRENEGAAAETIENNVRKLILDESPINPKYYDKMSQLLDALIAQRKQNALSYQQYLEQIVELTRQSQQGPQGAAYPAAIDSPAKRALYDNLGRNEPLVIAMDSAVRQKVQDAWRSNVMKTRRVRQAIADVLGEADDRIEPTLELIKNQNDY
ncbi:MAG: hypothetical protein RL685_4528 [Pseudomonadota bacterium]|jgi:type I restriction enzyme R subunit